jgi:hypothetical protein
VNHALDASAAGVDDVAEGKDRAEGATDGGIDGDFNVAPGAVGGRGIRRCLGIDAGGLCTKPLVTEVVCSSSDQTGARLGFGEGCQEAPKGNRNFDPTTKSRRWFHCL